MTIEPQQTPDDREPLGTDTDVSATAAATGSDVPWREEQVREARKRAVIWGLAGGLIMSLLLVGACVLLILAADA